MEIAEVVLALSNGRSSDVHAALTEEFAAEVAEADLAAVWNSAVSELGSFAAAGDPIVLYDMPLRFERGTAHLQTVHRGDRIAALVLRPGEPSVRFGE